MRKFVPTGREEGEREAFSTNSWSLRDPYPSPYGPWCINNF